MRTAPAPRWTISFADLALLLLGCLVMAHALRPAEAPIAAAAPASVATVELAAADLFEPGEARLTAAGRVRLDELAGSAAGRRLALASRGTDGGGARLDAFELAAARTAAIARALELGEVDVSASAERAADAGRGQRITIRIHP
jgi:hypothetical protein